MGISIDRLVRSRRRTVAILIERDGRLTVRAPLHLSGQRIQAFVDSHAGWIAKNQARMQTAPPPPVRRYSDGETFRYLGNAYPLLVVPTGLSKLVFDGASFKLPQSRLAKAEETFVRWYKLQARRLLEQRVAAIAVKHDFRYQKIRISSARTRWGSCSSRGTLSFTYRLIMAPIEVVDYVVMHELVHTQIKNHSKTFWNKLGELMPDYRNRLAWLKKNGKYLM